MGEVHFVQNDPDAVFEFQAIGPLSPEQRAEALARLGLADAQRYDHDRCPIDPGAASVAQDCVVIVDGGVYCHRCASHGVTAQPGLTPGFLPFRTVVGGAPTELDRLVTGRVHWIHVRLVLLHTSPHLSEPILRRAYQLSLESRYGGDDPRIRGVFNDDLNVVLGALGWLDSTNLEPTIICDDLASSLPHVLELQAGDEDSGPKTVVNKARRARVKHRAPEYYRPIRRVIGIAFGDDGVIPVMAPPSPRYAIEVLRNPLGEAEAFARIVRAFPDLSQECLRAAQAAAICGEVRRGQPPMLVCTGPSGSGKEQTIRLAASFMGDDILKLSRAADSEKFFRQIGSAVADGKRFLVIDELGKDRELDAVVTNILTLSGTVDWRRLYRNGSTSSPLRAALFFPCVVFPERFCDSPEVDRRVRQVRLPRRVPNWANTSGGDTAAWRDRNADNAHAANSFLTHVFDFCRRNEFLFERVADELSLGRVSDGAIGADPELLQRLYRHVRGEDGERRMIAGESGFKGRGWCDLDAPVAQDILRSSFPPSQTQARAERTDVRQFLSAPDWNAVLEIEAPAIQCRVRGHNKFGLRFESAGVMRGREVVNEDLPAVGGSSEHPSPAPPPTLEPSSSRAPEDVLRDGGFPT